MKKKLEEIEEIIDQVEFLPDEEEPEYKPTAKEVIRELQIGCWAPLQEVANHRIDLNRAEKEINQLIERTILKNWLVK